MIRVLTLIFKEMLYRKVGFLLSLVAAVAAVALCVAISMTQAAAQKETRRTMRDIGSNILIVPQETDEYEYLRTGLIDATMPEDFVNRLAKAKKISYNHLIATLKKEITITDRKANVKRKVRLVGVSPALHPPGRKKKSKMGFAIKKDHVYLGSRVAELLDAKKGGEVKIHGKTWKVERIEPEKGEIEDITIFGLLGDVQTVLKMDGLINEIKAIDCLRCAPGEEKDAVVLLRKEFQRILPEAKVFHLTDIAKARTDQRRMLDEYSSFLIAVLLIASAAWLGVLSAINVRERISEIGLLRALGYGSGSISSLVLGRAALIGLLGALLGFGIGCLLALEYGPAFFPATAKAIKVQPAMLGWTVLAAPLLAMLASFIPASLAVSHDPAVTLRQD